ncbi:MAG: FecR domain-containing protein [Rhodoferax sp.]|nr:FecR domain-containing protein [Rhodoferax sp.]
MYRMIKRTLGAMLLGVSALAMAQPAGEVEFSRGVGFAQSPGQLPRTLGKGLPLKEGDRLTTAQGAAAIIKLQDGTRMTLRPNSEMIVQQYQFKEGSSDNSMVMQLLRGGFRAITGLISKNSPNAARVQTSTSTIGIRGTDFDARICTNDCKAEAANVSEVARPNAVQASARLVQAKGDISASDGTGAKRKLYDGGSVYAGETVELGAGARGVLAFRDDSRLTLGSSTRFKVDSFVFDDKNPTEGRFLVSLLRGSLRALTGLIGKANNRNVSFSTPTSTIGIRGTGLDMDCGSGESCNVFTWQGTIEVLPIGKTVFQTLHAGQGLVVGPSTTQPLTAPTLENLPRPDTVPVNLPQLFSSGGVSGEDEGLFVFVRDGHIDITSGRETLHLGRGETGFAGDDGRTGRPADTPLFIQFDRVPMPNSSNPRLASVIGEITPQTRNQCR